MKLDWTKGADFLTGEPRYYASGYAMEARYCPDFNSNLRWCIVIIRYRGKADRFDPMRYFYEASVTDCRLENETVLDKIKTLKEAKAFCEQEFEKELRQ